MKKARCNFLNFHDYIVCLVSDLIFSPFSLKANPCYLIICNIFTPINLTKSLFKMSQLHCDKKCTQLQHPPCLQLDTLTVISHTHTFYWISATWNLPYFMKQYNVLVLLQLWLVINHLCHNFYFYLPLTLQERIISILLNFLCLTWAWSLEFNKFIMNK